MGFACLTFLKESHKWPLLRLWTVIRRPQSWNAWKIAYSSRNRFSTTMEWLLLLLPGLLLVSAFRRIRLRSQSSSIGANATSTYNGTSPKCVQYCMRQERVGGLSPGKEWKMFLPGGKNASPSLFVECVVRSSFFFFLFLWGREGLM